MSETSFSDNLRLLCSYTSSVSSVCRSLSINRQQFARYLNGENYPSDRNMRKICDFFGVEEDEILLPTANFRELIVLKPSQQNLPINNEGRADNSTQTTFQAALASYSNVPRRKYLGDYFRYLKSLEYPGYFIRAFARIYPEHGSLQIKSIERLCMPNANSSVSEVFKYQGELFFLTDRIFILETDSFLKNAITETILYPSHKNPMRHIFGKALGVSSGPSREPYMTPIVYESLGVNVDVRAELKRCGLIAENDSQFDPALREYLASGPF